MNGTCQPDLDLLQEDSPRSQAHVFLNGGAGMALLAQRRGDHRKSSGERCGRRLVKDLLVTSGPFVAPTAGPITSLLLNQGTTGLATGSWLRSVAALIQLKGFAAENTDVGIGLSARFL